MNGVLFGSNNKLYFKIFGPLKLFEESVSKIFELNLLKPDGSSSLCKKFISFDKCLIHFSKVFIT